MGYTVRPMHILFRPCGLTLDKRNDRQRSPTAIMRTNSSMRMRVRINVVGVVLSINYRRKRVSGRGLCEPFTQKNTRTRGWVTEIGNGVGRIKWRRRFALCIRADWLNCLNIIDKIDSKIGFEMNLIVVEAIRGRCASFTVLTATVSEIFGGQTTPCIYRCASLFYHEYCDCEYCCLEVDSTVVDMQVMCCS